MKKITIIILFMFGAFTVSMAQTTSAQPPATSKQDKATIAAQKKADREAKALAKKQAKAAATLATTDAAAQKKADRAAKALAKKQAKAASQPTTTVSAATPPATTAHLNKNGTPDKRFKSSKQATTAAPQAPVPAAPMAQSTTVPSTTSKATTHVTSGNTAKVADKAISTDAKGRTIYQGPRGGKYYINKNGNKEYVK